MRECFHLLALQVLRELHESLQQLDLPTSASLPILASPLARGNRVSPNFSGRGTRAPQFTGRARRRLLRRPPPRPHFHMANDTPRSRYAEHGAALYVRASARNGPKLLSSNQSLGCLPFRTTSTVDANEDSSDWAVVARPPSWDRGRLARESRQHPARRARGTHALPGTRAAPLWYTTHIRLFVAGAVHRSGGTAEGTHAHRARSNAGSSGFRNCTPSTRCPFVKSSVKIVGTWFRRAVAQICASK